MEEMYMLNIMSKLKIIDRFKHFMIGRNNAVDHGCVEIEMDRAISRIKNTSNLNLLRTDYLE